MALTSLQIKRLKTRDKPFWLTDEKGLRLLVKPNGAKYWRLKYRFAGKQKTLALGVFPDISLKQARLERDKAKIQISQGIDPCREKQILKKEQQFADGKRFSILAHEWWKHQKGTWTEDHANRIWIRLKDNSFETLDSYPIDKIRPQDVLMAIRQIESRNALDVASRVLQDIRRVFRYGIQVGKITNNPATDLHGALKTRKPQHRASLPVNELGQFLIDLHGYSNQGRLLTQLAIELLLLTFLRPGELRAAQWSEIDIKKCLWRIPGPRMKMNNEHLVPLSKQAIAVLKEIEPITRQYELIFPSERNRHEPISDNTMRRAIFRLGYDGETKGKSRMTPHGFRANASSVLNEQGFNPDAIERQLSHKELNGVRAAYTHHARYLQERISMMQWWADFLDEQSASAKLPCG